MYKMDVVFTKVGNCCRDLSAQLRTQFNAQKAILIAMGYCILNLLSSKTEADVEVVDEKASPKTPTSTQVWSP